VSTSCRFCNAVEALLATADRDGACVCELQWRLATLLAIDSNECQNIAASVVNNFETCNITLLPMRIRQNADHDIVEHDTLVDQLNAIKYQSRSKR